MRQPPGKLPQIFWIPNPASIALSDLAWLVNDVSWSQCLCVGLCSLTHTHTWAVPLNTHYHSPPPLHTQHPGNSFVGGSWKREEGRSQKRSEKIGHHSREMSRQSRMWRKIDNPYRDVLLRILKVYRITSDRNDQDTLCIRSRSLRNSTIRSAAAATDQTLSNLRM